MDQELTSALVEVINMAVSAKDFVIAETPDVIRQLILYKTVLYGVGFGVGLLLSLFSLVSFFVAVDYDEEFKIFLSGMGVLLGIALVGLNLDIFTVTLAPKVYLIEYAASLVK